MNQMSNQSAYQRNSNSNSNRQPNSQAEGSSRQYDQQDAYSYNNYASQRVPQYEDPMGAEDDDEEEEEDEDDEMPCSADLEGNGDQGVAVQPQQDQMDDNTYY